MVFDGLKPLNSIENEILFLVFGHSQKLWKNDAKGSSKVIFWGPKWRHWASTFDLSSDLWRFGAMPQKPSFLDAFPMDETIEPWNAKGSK